MGTEPLAFRDACSRSQVSFDEKLPVSGRQSRGAGAWCRTGWQLIQKPQACQRVADCAGYIEEVSNSRAFPKEGLTGGDHSDQRQTEKPSAVRSRRISADECNVVGAAGGHQPSVQLVNLAADAGAGNRQG